MTDLRAIGILEKKFGNRLQQQVPLQNYATAHVGGDAAYLVTVRNTIELVEVVQICWDHQLNSFLLGAGSNILFSDEGFDGLVILNHAKKIEIKISGEIPTLWVEFGASLGLVARKAALAGLSGLEWAATIPGTIGGAIYGNAGAHGRDMHSNLLLAEILQHEKGKSVWKNEDFQFNYRSSILKRLQANSVILSATLKCQYDDPQLIKERMNSFREHRRRTQPPGASMGSMFKNPVGDYAGRLIEAAGLKGYSIGGVKVSEVHANFFVNSDQATARDIYDLVYHVQKTVRKEFNVALELEVEMIGFDHMENSNIANHGRASQ